MSDITLVPLKNNFAVPDALGYTGSNPDVARLLRLIASRLVIEGECFIWQGCRSKHGYGKGAINKKVQAALGLNRKFVYFHRTVFIALHGPVEKGRDVMHSCDRPSCINPLHLSEGTHQDNVQDMVSKNRQASESLRGLNTGERAGQCVYTDDQIEEMRRRVRDGETQRSVQSAFGISHAQLCKVISYSVRKVPTRGREEVRDPTLWWQPENVKDQAVYWECRGERKRLSEWARQLEVSVSFLKERVRRGWTVEQALTIPKIRGRRPQDQWPTVIPQSGVESDFRAVLLGAK